MNRSSTSELRTWWWREQFDPGWVGFLLTPFFFARHGLRRALAEPAAALTGEILDVGCGRKPYRDLVPAARYIGVDLDTPAMRKLGCADVYYDGRRLPFADGSFDGVLCSQVFEHVFEPEAFLREVGRVLRPNGCLLLTVPFAWDEHEQPQDFARYSSFGLRATLERSGFSLVSAQKTCADFRAVAQLMAAYVYKATRTRSRLVSFLTQVFLIAPINAIGGLLALLLPRNPDFYLDNVVLARRTGEPPDRLRGA